MKNLKCFAVCQNGTVAIEFAIVGGLAIAALLCSIEYSTWIRDQRAVASASAAVAQSIADSGVSTKSSRTNLRDALTVMGINSGSSTAVNVFHVSSDNDGKVKVANTWSTGSGHLAKNVDPADWQIIQPYLNKDEGGIVACAYKLHTWVLIPLGKENGSLVKSCNAAVPVATADIDWD